MVGSSCVNMRRISAVFNFKLLCACILCIYTCWNAHIHMSCICVGVTKFLIKLLC